MMVNLIQTYGLPERLGQKLRGPGLLPPEGERQPEILQRLPGRHRQGQREAGHQVADQLPRRRQGVRIRCQAGPANNNTFVVMWQTEKVVAASGGGISSTPAVTNASPTPTVYYTSGNRTVASVDSSGSKPTVTITAKNPGRACITCQVTLPNGTRSEALCYIVVYPN